MPRRPTAGQKADPARARRSASPGLVVLAAGCSALVAVYLGNAAWNLLHLRHGDMGHLLAAAALPVPLVGQGVPQWVELASAALLLLLVLLSITATRAASRSRSRNAEPPLAVETYEIFRGTRARTHGPVAQTAPPPALAPDFPPAPPDAP